MVDAAIRIVKLPHVIRRMMRTASDSRVSSQRRRAIFRWCGVAAVLREARVAFVWLGLAGIACAAEPPSLDKLVVQLSSDGVNTRREAAYQLGNLGAAAKPALPALIKALDDPDKQVWSYAIAAITALGPEAREAVPVLLEDMDSSKVRGRRERDKVQAVMRSAHALSRIGPAAVKPLIAALAGSDSWLRAGAARALGEMGSAAGEAIPALRANLGHGDGVVRREVVDAFGQIGAPAVSPLVEALGSNEPIQRVTAVLALTEIGPAAAPALAKIEKIWNEDRDPLARAAALLAVAKLSPDPARVAPQVIAGLQSEDAGIRLAATNAILARPPSAPVIAALVGLLKGGNHAHSQRAAVILGRLGSAAKSAADEIVAVALREAPPPPALIETLVQLGPAAVAALIGAFHAQDIDALTKDHWLVQLLKTIGAPAVQPLAAALGSESIVTRFGAARTLGEMGSVAQPAARALLPVAEDGEPRLRAMALGTLMSVKAEPTVIVSRLEAALKDAVPIVRLTAAQLVPYLGEQGAALAPALIVAAQDASAPVRYAVRQALQRLVDAGLPEPVLARAREALAGSAGK